ncbi:hypothetical protein HN954_02530 [bacterium]|jgi:hypothetical protein|nr:hypothetical protein [bacterium]MBT6831636.1 hypothetical protein [bacterium]MBT6996282.1 hypothetical protein [bacterium]MBT7772960.1 hypothetical protein [bacterium]
MVYIFLLLGLVAAISLPFVYQNRIRKYTKIRLSFWKSLVGVVGPAIATRIIIWGIEIVLKTGEEAPLAISLSLLFLTFLLFALLFDQLELKKRKLTKKQRISIISIILGINILATIFHGIGISLL